MPLGIILDAFPPRVQQYLQLHIVVIVILSLPLPQLLHSPGIASEVISLLPIQVFAFLEDFRVMQIDLGVHTVRYSIRYDTKDEDSGANGGKAHVVNQGRLKYFEQHPPWKKQI